MPKLKGIGVPQNAQYAENHTWQSNQNPPQLVPVSVLGSSAGGKEDVYNLEVEGKHEYFANGILVHNCVWCLTELAGFDSIASDDVLKDAIR